MVFALEQVVFLKSFDKKKSPAGGLFFFKKAFWRIWRVMMLEWLIFDEFGGIMLLLKVIGSLI